MGRIHDAITRTGTDFQRMLVDKEAPRSRFENPAPTGSIEPLLEHAKFGRHQIDQQELAELREGLIHIEAVMSDPLGWLARNQSHGVINLEESDLRSTLAERKRRMLRRIDLLVNSSKIQKIRLLSGGISDRRTRSAILKELSELLAKDEVIEAEYRRLEAEHPAVPPEQGPTGEVSASGADAKNRTRGLSAAEGFFALPAGAMLLAAAAVSTSLVLSMRASSLEIILAAVLILTGGSFLRRVWNVTRKGSHR